MSDVVATPEAAPVAIDPSANRPAVPSAAPVTTNGPPADKPEWLDARLEQARRAALKDAGFDSPEAAKKAAEAIKAQEEANKSEAQKRTDAENALKKSEKQIKEMGEARGAFAKSQMTALSDALRAAVVAVAGDDAAKQLKTIEALRPTWANASTSSAQVAAPDTAPGRSAPKDGGSTVSPPDHKSVHAELNKTNPVLAARYAQTYGVFDP